MFDHRHYERLGLAEVRDKVLDGRRLSLEDGERLFACPDLHALAALAHHVRLVRHGDRAHYVLNRHINYTNVCVNKCRFCAFSRDEGQDGAFVLGLEDIIERLNAPEAKGVTEIHIVGGCHPSLPLRFFEELLDNLRRRFPLVELKGFTAVEIEHFARLEGISTRETLQRLQKAGLVMLPGGGAEVFAPEVRARICPEKISGERWLEIHAEAHELGLASNATLLFGHVESFRQRLEHLDALRQAQDRTGGFVCFIPLPFLRKNNALGLDGESQASRGLDELRTVAVSRLMLDNIPHIKAYWVMLGVKQAVMALHHGADDLDGVVVEERIGHMAGAESPGTLSRDGLEQLIRAAGFVPTPRTARFAPAEEAAHA